MHVTGAHYVDPIGGGNATSKVEAAPGFQDAFETVLNESSISAPTRAERLHAIAAQYDPRYMTFLERREMMRELAALDLVDDRAARVTSFHPGTALRLDLPGGNSPEQVVAAMNEKVANNRWANTKQNYLEITQHKLSLGSHALDQEMLAVMGEICQIRDSDPVLSQQRVPEIHGSQDVMFTIGKGLSAEHFGGDNPGFQALQDYAIDFETMALRAAGISDEDEKKLEERREIAKAEAAAEAVAAAHVARADAAAQADDEAGVDFGAAKLESVEAAQLQAAQAWFEHEPRFL